MAPHQSQQFNHQLAEVLESAARLQRIVPDAVLVGGTAAAYYVGHRLSFDHDHVLDSLQGRFDLIFEALEREGDFVLSRAVPGKIILGELGGIEIGVRQLIRKRPLETQLVILPSGEKLTVPVEAEILRIKSFLIVKRNQVRDFLDVAALASRYGVDAAAHWLSDLDEYYADDTADKADRPVLTQLIRQLSYPNPKDSRTIKRLTSYKGLNRRWHDWAEVAAQCGTLAIELSKQ